jgi:glycosyltransferase involved in cell wall biosynthesis
VPENNLVSLTAAQLEPVFWTPKRRGKGSAWWGHVPFAFWITVACNPRKLVELGTLSGVSYAAFCEAVAQAKLATRCYAAPAWTCDAEPGFDLKDAYNELKRFNEGHYASFSEILGTNVDAAYDFFGDASIDLLHLDEFRSYEAVRGVFETWRPKLSNRAVVLFHKTSTRNRDFGVGRFFRELRDEFATFEFTHSDGLGIVVVGSDTSLTIKELCALRQEEEIWAIRQRFSHLGARWEEAADASLVIARKEAELTRKDAEVARSNRELSRANLTVKELAARLRRLEESVAAKDAQIAEYSYHLERINASPWWRLGMWLDKAVHLPSRLFGSSASKDSSAKSEERDPEWFYQNWVRLYDTISDEDRNEIRRHILSLGYQPLISIVMPAYNTPEKLFREAIESVLAQLYTNWELCVADDASPSATVAHVLKEFAVRDSRIKWVRRELNGHISQASNSALKLATGEFVALMEHDDILPDHALYEVVAKLNSFSDADILYSDEDKITDDGVRHSPYFKTDWNPELLLGQNMISHLGVYRRSLLEKIGGFRTGFEGNQDYDLALRAANATRPEKIRHIPAILYHWRGGSQTASFLERQLERCVTAARRAKTEFLLARNEPAEVLANPLAPNWERIRRAVPSPSPLVSLIIPTRNRHDLLGPCVEGLLHRTTYQQTEIIIVDHESDDRKTLALLKRLSADERVRVLPYKGPFNYSDMNNQAVIESRGEIIGLINNDVDIIEPEWLTEMTSLAVRPENGAIGAKLLYPNGRVQHGGVILGLGGVAGHAHLNASRNDSGYFGRLVLTSNVSAVTGACLVVRKSVFEEVGGLNAVDLPVAYNDVDLCLKIRAKGYRNVWTPFALLYHHESPSRGSDMDADKIDRARREADYMRRVWGEELYADPYFNLNLSLQSKSFELAFPPRRVKPWRSAGLICDASNNAGT